MESANDLKITVRQQALSQWLRAQVGPSLRVEPMPGDASFRRYFRIQSDNGTFVAMDSPPPQENCRPFIAIAQALRALSLQAPEIIANDSQQGFLLLTDFGDLTYLKALRPDNAETLYDTALDALTTIQACRDVAGQTIPPFTAEWMWQEWAWHKEWFLDKLLGVAPTPALDACYALIVASAVNQPQVFMHRDYHSANLMVIPKGVGILDFQDAFIGPITYDLVSLLRDCYIDWPEAKVNQWALLYLHKLQARQQWTDVTDETFLRWFDWMGLERHLKALFTFARKHVRDHQPGYLKHIPRTLNYVLSVSERYPELAPLHAYMLNTVQPLIMRMPPCAQ